MPQSRDWLGVRRVLGTGSSRSWAAYVRPEDISAADDCVGPQKSTHEEETAWRRSGSTQSAVVDSREANREDDCTWIGRACWLFQGERHLSTRSPIQPRCGYCVLGKGIAHFVGLCAIGQCTLVLVAVRCRCRCVALWWWW